MLTVYATNKQGEEHAANWERDELLPVYNYGSPKLKSIKVGLLHLVLTYSNLGYSVAFSKRVRK